MNARQIANALRKQCSVKRLLEGVPVDSSDETMWKLANAFEEIADADDESNRVWIEHMAKSHDGSYPHRFVFRDEECQQSS